MKLQFSMLNGENKNYTKDKVKYPRCMCSIWKFNKMQHLKNPTLISTSPGYSDCVPIS